MQSKRYTIYFSQDCADFILSVLRDVLRDFPASRFDKIARVRKYSNGRAEKESSQRGNTVRVESVRRAKLL